MLHYGSIFIGILDGNPMMNNQAIFYWEIVIERMSTFFSQDSGVPYLKEGCLTDLHVRILENEYTLKTHLLGNPMKFS